MRPFASVYPSTSIAVNKNSFSAKQWAPQQQLDVSGRSCKSGARSIQTANVIMAMLI